MLFFGPKAHLNQFSRQSPLSSKDDSAWAPPPGVDKIVQKIVKETMNSEYLYITLPVVYCIVWDLPFGDFGRWVLKEDEMSFCSHNRHYRKPIEKYNYCNSLAT